MGGSLRDLGPADLLLIARSDWRQRWRSLILLALLVAGTLATTVATLTAAARSETAFARLREATNASDVIAYYEGRGASEISAFEAVDGVEAAAPMVELFVRPAGTEYFPDFQIYSVAPLRVAGAATLNAPVITAGRAVDPGQADEIALSEEFASTLGVGAGETMWLESMTDEWIDLAFNGGDPGPPDGPRVEVSVVGVARTPADFSRWEGLIFLSPAFAERYGEQMRGYYGLEVRLDDAARRALDSGSPPQLPGGEVRPSPFGDSAAADDGLATIATALRLVAAAAVVAGAVAVVLMLSRAARLVLQDHETLRALGMTRRALGVAAALVFVPAIIGGLAVGTALGIVAAPLVAIGLARAADPAVGAVVANTAVAAMSLGAAAATLSVALVLAGRDVAVTRSAPPGTSPRGVQLRAPLALVIGVRHALFGEATRGGRSSRGAIAAVSAAIVVAIAALMVSASIERLQVDPTLTGQGGSRLIESGESLDVYDRAVPRLDDDERVESLIGLHIGFGITVAGVEETLLSYDLRRGDFDLSIIEGRAAAQADEVVLGPATIARVGQQVGDRIELVGPAGRDDFKIVGSVLFPEGDFQFDEGIALTVDGADRVLGDARTASDIHQIIFEWESGVDPVSADEELLVEGFQVFTNDRGLQPPPVSNLGQVSGVPRYLAAFVLALALATLGHALAASARLRSKELGTLRALGMTRRASAGVVIAQTGAITVVAMLLGLPLGLAAGRQIWAPIAHGVPVVVLAVTPWSWIAVALAAVVLGATALTAVPAARVLRLRPADILRRE